MIIDSLENAKTYYGISDSIKKALQYIETHDLAAMAPGKYRIDGDDLTINIGTEYTPKGPEEGIWEAHRDYIDVQYVIEGCEYMGYAAIDTLTVTQAYRKDIDAELYAGKGDRVLVTEGSFVIFFPQDGHMPGIQACVDQKSRKAVVKVKYPFV